MGIKLYGTQPSPPVHSVRLMLESKGLDYKPVWLLPGLHPALLRTRGFSGGTVPAIKLDGRKLQQSRAISRALEEVKPEPPLFPPIRSGASRSRRPSAGETRFFRTCHGGSSAGSPSTARRHG